MSKNDVLFISVSARSVSDLEALNELDDVFIINSPIAVSDTLRLDFECALSKDNQSYHLANLINTLATLNLSVIKLEIAKVY